MLVLPLAGEALAHTGLVSSEPADGDVVEGPLESVNMDFTRTPGVCEDGIIVGDAVATRTCPSRSPRREIEPPPDSIHHCPPGRTHSHG